MEGEQNSIYIPKIFPNPENSLEIKIPFFEGPLDLLLHLIRKKEVSIEEVRLSELTASYMEYVEMMQSINLDLAGEFLEIAAMLILIKSRHLLPRPLEILKKLKKRIQKKFSVDDCWNISITRMLLLNLVHWIF